MGEHAGRTGPPEKPALSEEQQRVLDIVLAGKSVFFTGPAGTGKSFLLREIIHNLRHGATYVTALTGIAAVNIGGTTLHSFAGIGLGQEAKEKLTEKVRRGRKSRENWKRVRTLIIDEVSMMDADLFTKLDYIGRALKCDLNQPFGGIQLVLCGDFFQLPPVSKNGKGMKYCFQSPTWNECVPLAVELSHVFRQKEPELLSMLQEVRYGQLSNQTVQKLTSLKRPLKSDEGIKATKLYCRNKDVDAENQACLDYLGGKPMVFTGYDKVFDDSIEHEHINKYFMVQQNLVLKEGAQVMLLHNLDDKRGLVNGSRGVVRRFLDPAETGEDEALPVVYFHGVGEIIVARHEFKWERNGYTVVLRTQVPLKLAWAITIHKSQGMTIDMLEVHLQDCFDAGQAYVALSRSTKLEGLRVLSFDPKKITTDPRVVKFHQSLVKVCDLPADKCKPSAPSKIVYADEPAPTRPSLKHNTFLPPPTHGLTYGFSPQTQPMTPIPPTQQMDPAPTPLTSHPPSNQPTQPLQSPSRVDNGLPSHSTHHHYVDYSQPAQQLAYARHTIPPSLMPKQQAHKPPHDHAAAARGTARAFENDQEGWMGCKRPKN